MAQEGEPAAARGPVVAAALVAVVPAAAAARGLAGPVVAAGAEAGAGAVRELVGVAEEARSSRLTSPGPVTSTSAGKCPIPALVALLGRWAGTPLLLADLLQPSLDRGQSLRRVSERERAQGEVVRQKASEGVRSTR